MLHRIISVRLIVAVPLQRIIAGTDRQAADAEALLACRVEQRMHHLRPFLIRQGAERCVPQLIEAAAEALQRLVCLRSDR
ncbi:hypothetical protein D3C81_2137590 [compost metagenome]